MTEAAIVGLGYIIGLRYALIIACGSFLSWWVMIPMIGMLGKGVNVDGQLFRLEALAGMETGDIFSNFVRPVGIGAIAMSGLIGVWKSRSIILGAFALAAQAGVRPPTILGVSLTPQRVLPGSTRSGEKARKKSRLARSPLSSRIGSTTSWVVPG